MIVCRDLSRLTRDPVQGITLISETWPEIAKRYGRFEVWYFGEDDYGLGINFVSGRGVKEARRSLNVAAEYVETISRNVRRAKLRHAVAGRPSGGWRPFGYEGDGKVRSIRESEAELVREAAQRVLSGDTTYTVAKDWNRRGNVSPRGGQWRPKSVRQNHKVRSSVMRPGRPSSTKRHGTASARCSMPIAAPCKRGAATC